MKARTSSLKATTNKPQQRKAETWWKRSAYIGGAVLLAVALLFASGYLMDAIRHAILSFKQLKAAIGT